MKKPRIEKDIPPPPKSKLARQCLELEELDIGDSFIIKGTYADQPSYQRLISGYYTAADRLGFRIATRKENKGIRLWRTK